MRRSLQRRWRSRTLAALRRRQRVDPEPGPGHDAEGAFSAENSWVSRPACRPGAEPPVVTRLPSARATSRPATISSILPYRVEYWPARDKRSTPDRRQVHRLGPVAEGVAAVAQAGSRSGPYGRPAPRPAATSSTCDLADQPGGVEGDPAVHRDHPPHTPLRPAIGVTGTRASAQAARTWATWAAPAGRTTAPGRAPWPSPPTRGRGATSPRPASTRACRRSRRRCPGRGTGRAPGGGRPRPPWPDRPGAPVTAGLVSSRRTGPENRSAWSAAWSGVPSEFLGQQSGHPRGGRHRRPGVLQAWPGAADRTSSTDCAISVGRPRPPRPAARGVRQPVVRAAPVAPGPAPAPAGPRCRSGARWSATTPAGRAFCRGRSLCGAARPGRPGSPAGGARDCGPDQLRRRVHGVLRHLAIGREFPSGDADDPVDCRHGVAPGKISRPRAGRRRPTVAEVPPTRRTSGRRLSGEGIDGGQQILDVGGVGHRVVERTL